MSYLIAIRSLIPLLHAVLVADVLYAARGVGGEVLLGLGHEALQALDVLALRLVVEHVRHVLGEDLLSPCTRVDAHHGDADGPGRVPYIDRGS